MKKIQVVKNGKMLLVEVYAEWLNVCGGIWVNAYIPEEKMYCKYYPEDNTLLRMVRAYRIV